MSLEPVRRWISTLGLAALGLGVLILALRPPAPALADEPAQVAPPSCTLIDSGKLSWEKAGEDVATQATALLAERAGRDHAVVLPFGRLANGSGGIYSVLCLW